LTVQQVVLLKDYVFKIIVKLQSKALVTQIRLSLTVYVNVSTWEKAILII